jgi:hypothetical protein
VTVKPSNPDPLVQIENAQKILAKADASLAQLEEAKVELDHVLAGAAAEREEIAARRPIETNALMPAAALDKALDGLDRLEKSVGRRVEIVSTVRTALMARLDDAREAAAEEQRRSRYAQALELHVTATNVIKTFLNKIGQEGRDALQIYLESEAATAAVNKDLPPGAMRIPTIENERMGSHPPAKISERRVQWFVHGRDRIAPVGSVEAYPNANGNGLWTIYKRSNAIQGDETIGPCVVVDFVEVLTAPYLSSPLEALSTSLKIPEFAAPPPKLGRGERRTMPLAEWRALNGEPAGSEQVLQVAAE